MGVFEFVLVLVLISTVGKVLASRSARPTPLPPASPSSAEIQMLEESIGQLSSRLEKLEEERDFYKDLLDPPDRGGRLPPGGS